MSTAIQTTGSATWAYMGDSIDTAGRLAKVLVGTGLAPAGMTPAQAFYILLAGKEIGVRGPIEALRHIVVIKGKPTMSAELMRAFMLAAGCRLKWVRQDSTGATLEVTRPDGTVGTFSFLEPDARAAGLLKQGSPWTSYPAAMYAARATSIAARLFCPDMVRGATYTPEELGAAVVLADDGGEHSALPANPAPAPHDVPPTGHEVPAGTGESADAGTPSGDEVPFDEPEKGDLPAPASGPDSSAEPAPEKLTNDEVDRMTLILAELLGLPTNGGPIVTLESVEVRLRTLNAPFSSGQLDKLNRKQAKLLLEWVKKNVQKEAA